MSEIIHKVTPDQNDVLHHALNAYIHLLIQQKKKETPAFAVALALRDMTEAEEDGSVRCPVDFLKIMTVEEARRELVEQLVIKLFKH